MLSGYSRAERFAETMEIFHAMRAAICDELLPTRVSIAAALTACANLLDLESGVEIHALAARSGVEADVGGLLIHMYAACGDLDAANRVFDVAMGGASINRDLSSWNSMITAYTDRNLWEEALSLVHQMHHQGMAFDDISFVTALNACAAAGYRGIPHGTSVHLCVAEAGREEDVIIRTALLNMYGKCRDLCRADAVFDALRRSGQRLDLIAWNAMGSALAQHEEFERVLTLYGEMLLEGVTPDEISFVNALTAAATAGRETLAAVHSHVVQRGMNRDVVVATVLVAAYGSAAEVRRAEESFAAVPPYRRDVVLWNAMINAYGGTPPALRTYDSMDIAPDKLTLVLALNACAGMAELAAGERIHRRAIDLGFDRDVGVITALIHMYASCGRLEQSQEIFHGAQEHTMFMWNALVSGFARRGQSERAIALFERMQQSGHRADAIGFVSILSACSQAGLIGRGCGYFASLLHDHGILPYREHYACMIDLFGRAGRLEEAEEWLRKMPAHKLSKSVWETLLGACSIHSDVKRGRRAAEELFEMQSRKSSPYVIMAKLAMLSSNRGES
ncbi:putative pentatricopeptide repeat-containing protein At3g23330 [Selaginella moellendorffii]|uniref:putative pentatricopeptide repeat-containing protein At3g23330 n=1 Tax=Selaginella moellendorffii TaxID=88036 RepID=UPI000D1C4233|nr:putative pentatricopeptide repeat-containing protein At3g23330 [Selaginella moellendorffii]|eukprot:XP_024540230.1 putative pentatricopeptide repeat-containing protein At3g23330 [Selaginella moellendorffii]